MFERLPPGAGELDTAGFLRTLAEMGVRAPVGSEVYAQGADDDPAETASRLAKATRHVLADI